jgi:FkbH-like protein
MPSVVPNWPPARVDRLRPAKITIPQQRVWFFQQRDGGSSQHVPTALRLHGAIDVYALEQALDELVRRHEVLRTTYTEVSGELRAVVHPQLFPLFETSEIADRHQERAILDAEVARPFDLRSGSPLRAHLFRISDEEHVLVLTIHHIATDLWSNGVLFRELSALYEAQVRGTEAELPPEAVAFVDYAEWQANWLHSRDAATHLAYWHEQLRGAPPTSTVPPDRPLPERRSYRGSQRVVSLPEHITHRVRAVARAAGVTPFIVLLASYWVLLSRASGQEDLVVGTLTAGRGLPGVEGSVGYFVNVLPLRADLRGDPLFLDLVHRARNVVRDAFAHELVPFEKILEGVDVERDGEQRPLFQTMFIVQNTPRPSMAVNGLRCDLVPVGLDLSTSDLVMRVYESGDRMTVALEYDTDLYDDRTADELLERYRAILSDAIAQPARRLSDLPGDPGSPLPQAELEAIAASEGDSAAPRDDLERTLCELFAAALRVERVGIHDDFFALGGHSLLVMQLLARIYATLGAHVAVREFFGAPTVSGLAERIRAIGGGGAAGWPPPRLDRAGLLPTSVAQQRYWVLQQRDPRSSAHHVATALRIRGPFEPDTLRLALESVVRRHEALRTTFVTTPDGLRAKVHAELAPAFELADAGGDGLGAAVDAIVARPFDLEGGPLVRAGVLRVGGGEHVLVLVLHHIVTDGWSQGLLLRELSAAYEDLRSGRPPPANAPPIAYADYASWQSTWLAGEGAKALEEWRNRLAGAPAETVVPFDRAVPTSRTFRGSHVAFALAPDVAARVEEVAREHATTPFAVMLAAFDLVLAGETGTDDLVIGTLATGRTRPELQETLGVFVNLLPLRLRVDRRRTFAEHLEHAREVAARAFAAQDVPFERILDAVGAERPPNRRALVQTILALQNAMTAQADAEPTGALFQPQGLEVRAEASDIALSNADLMVRVVRRPEGLLGSIEYDVDLYDESTARRVADEYVALLEAVTKEPGLAVAEAIERHVAKRSAKGAPLRVAVAATFTAEPMGDVLELWLRELGYEPEVVWAPFGQVFQSLLDAGSELRRNAGGIDVVLVRRKDLGATPSDVAKAVADLRGALQASVDASGASHVLVVCPTDDTEEGRRADAALAEALGDVAGLDVVSAATVTKLYPVAEKYDAFAEEQGKIPYTDDYFTALGTVVCRRIRVARSEPKKVLVLDCDDTLWGGIVGEVGTQGVVIDEGRLALQRYALEQRRQGVLLCVVSKNNEADALAVFEERPEMLLRKEHLTSWRINWLPKSENLLDLARELELGVDSFVFLDDDAFVCAEARERAPGLLALQVPKDSRELAGFLRGMWALDRGRVTEEDRKRAQSYKEKAERERVRQTLSHAEFLATLGLVVEASPMKEAHVPRVAQLTQRTNQFNATTRRRTEAEVRGLAKEGLDALVVHVHDRFGDYGLTGLVIAGVKGDRLVVDTMLLSCRVLGRGVEHHLVRELGKMALDRGAKAVEIPFVASAKNAPYRSFFESLPGKREEEGERKAVVLAAEEARELRYEAATDAPAPVFADTKKAAPVAHASFDHGKAARELATVAAIRAALPKRVGTRAEARRGRPYVEPQGETEQTVARVWAEVLRVERVGRDDDFFELGGTSLLAVSVVAALRRRCGLELPLGVLFEASTVAALAQRIVGAAAAEEEGTF